MYKSSLRHTHDPVLLSLKVEVILSIHQKAFMSSRTTWRWILKHPHFHNHMPNCLTTDQTPWRSYNPVSKINSKLQFNYPIRYIHFISWTQRTCILLYALDECYILCAFCLQNNVLLYSQKLTRNGLTHD